MTLRSRYFGAYPVHAVVGEVPGSYTANDRFAVAHGMANFVGETGRRIPTVYDVVELVPDQYETQTLTITGTPDGGTFTLTFDGETTAAIAYNAATAAVEAALEALDNIGTGNVTVTGSGALPGNTHTISFAGGDLEGTFPVLITADGALLTGGTTPDAAVSVTNTLTHNSIGVVGVDETYIYLRCSATSGEFLILVG